MKALITGATGFIGRELASALAAADWQTTLLTRSQSRHLLPKGPFQVIEADLAEPAQLAKALSNQSWDVVVHAAAIRNRWGTPPAAYQAINVTATQTLLDALIGHAGRFVYISSVGVFGRPGVLAIDENFPVRVSPTWDYHSSKAASEKLTLARANEIEAVVVRPTITYGPGDTDGMVTRLIQMTQSGRFFRIGNGRNHVHLTYITDLIDGLQLAMTHPDAPGGTFILAGPEPITMHSLLNLIERQTSTQLPKWHLPYTAAYWAGAICESIFRWMPGHLTPPITRDKVENLCANRGFSWALAAYRLDYQPCWQYDLGLKHTIDWLSSRKEN